MLYKLNYNEKELAPRLVREEARHWNRLILGPAEGFSHRPGLFLTFGQKKKVFTLFVLILEIFVV